MIFKVRYDLVLTNCDVVLNVNKSYCGLAGHSFSGIFPEFFIGTKPC